MRLSNPAEEKKKQEIIETLETLCAYMIYRRNVKMAELETLKSAPKQSSKEFNKEIESQERTIKELTT